MVLGTTILKNIIKSQAYSYTDNDVTPRLVVTYQATEKLSVYVNYSESFNPTSASEQEDVVNAGSLQPESGKQTEIGMKNQWFDGKMMSTFAIYRINKQNVVMSNPEDTGPEDGIADLLYW